MAAVFISHASQDRAASEELKAVLARLGFERIFLDFDKDTGIGAGEDWERRLYEELSRCHAVILVLTPNWLASKWCFAELVQARALGKVILPITCAPLGPGVILPAVQAVDLVDWNAEGVGRLEERLRAIVDELARGFAFDATRPPYPGIHAFEAEDAAIYFGRDEEIRAVIERIEARRRHGGARLLVIIGASGSGKSSLLRAGVLPQVARQPRQWIALPPIRLEKAPVEALAKVVTEKAGAPAAWRDWHTRFMGPQAAAHAGEFLKDLRIGDARAATLLLSIDQFEEVFTVAAPDERDAFLRLLNGLLSASNDFPVVAVATGRADVLQGLLESGELAGLTETISLAPMPLERVTRLIEGPAAVAAITVEKGLAERISRDVAHAEALPLLAYTLRLLHERSPDRKRLTHAAYLALGDPSQALNPVQNSIRLAADGAIAGARPADEELAALRDAFVPYLVRVRLDDGTRVRQPARLAELPREAERLLRALIGARLLTARAADGSQVQGDAILEVTHEALFRAWPTLARWLDAEGAFLADLERVRGALQTWNEAPDDRKPQALMTGLLLSRARDWLAQFPRRFLGRDMDALRAFIAASAKAADAEAEQVRRRRRWTLRAALAAAIIFASAAGVAGWQYVEASRERARAEEQARRAETAFDAARGAVDSLLLNITDGLQFVEGMRSETIRLILETVQRTIDDLVRRAPDDRGLQRSRGQMWQRFGDVYARLGDLRRAREAFEECLTIARRLVAAEPGNLNYQNGVAVCLERVASARNEQGDRAGALTLYEEVVAIRRKFRSEQPADADSGLTYILYRIASLRATMGDPAGALAAYEEALDISRRNVAAQPDDPGWQHALSDFLTMVGELKLAAGDLTTGFAMLEESVTIRRKVVVTEPQNTRGPLGLADALYRLSRFRWETGDRTGALVNIEESLAILRRLAAADPTNTGQQETLAFALERLGYMHVLAGDPQRSLATYKECLTIRKALAAKDPSNLNWQWQLWEILNRIGDGQLTAKDPAAGATFEEGLALARRLASAQPNDNRAINLVAAIVNGGLARHAAGDEAGAREAFAEAIATAQRFVDAQPNDAQRLDQLGEAWFRLGRFREQTLDLAGALDAYLEALSAARRLVAAKPESSDFQVKLGASLEKVGETRLALGDRAGGLAAFEEVLAIARKLVSAEPDKPAWQTNLVEGLRNVARASNDVGQKRAVLTEALALVRALDARGVLTEEQKGWAAAMEADLIAL